MCEIQISDTGVGIAEQEQEAIYSEYYRLRGEHHGENAGLGLGLSIVRRFCDLLDIQLSLRSSPGQGSTFGLLVQTTEVAISVAQAPYTHTLLEQSRGGRG